MPVTKTAKRALRSSKRKFAGNNLLMKSLGIAVHAAQKSPTPKNIQKAYSLADKAAKKKTIHKNKASRIKARVSKFQKRSK